MKVGDKVALALDGHKVIRGVVRSISSEGITVEGRMTSKAVFSIPTTYIKTKVHS